jgi:NAD(P)-dependent dehydrogenase (short-subunit alcohol dehydrogenase family)
MDLKHKVAIVTGASAGIGRELAREFARQGARVTCAARREQKLAETVALIQDEGGEAIAVPTDITDREQVNHMVAETLKHFNQIDLLFNNAARLQAIGASWEIDPDDWWEDVQVNLLGTMMCCHAVLPHMIQRNNGIIINMEGGGGSGGANIGASAYGCSKAAIMRFTQSLAGELERIGSAVLVFCVNPGFVQTDMIKHALDTPHKQQWLSNTMSLIGSKKEVAPERCAKVTMRLLQIACPELNGRTFRQELDFDLIEQNLQRIKQEDLFTLHYKRLTE